MDELQALLATVKADKVGVVNLADHRDSSTAETALRLLPEAKSVVVVAMELFPELVQYLTSGRKVGELVLRDLFDRNADVVNGHLDWETYKLVKELHKLGYNGIPLTAGDSPFDMRFIEGTMNYKEAAMLAGVGIVGRHSMLLTPEFGARVRLSCLVTDAPFEETSSTISYDPCEDCGGACIKVCPVEAIKVPSEGETCNIDRYLCNTFLSSSGGCSECLRICPADKLFKNHDKS